MGIVLNHLHFRCCFVCAINLVLFTLSSATTRTTATATTGCTGTTLGISLMHTIHSSRTLHLFNICVNASLTQLSRHGATRLPLLMYGWHFSKRFSQFHFHFTFGLGQKQKTKTKQHLNHYSLHSSKAKQTFPSPALPALHRSKTDSDE